MAAIEFKKAGSIEVDQLFRLWYHKSEFCFFNNVIVSNSFSLSETTSINFGFPFSSKLKGIYFVTLYPFCDRYYLFLVVEHCANVTKLSVGNFSRFLAFIKIFCYIVWTMKHWMVVRSVKLNFLIKNCLTCLILKM